MIINSYTYIYLFAIFIIGIAWAIVMILIEKRKFLKKESSYDENIIDLIINNNNSECKNDYNIEKTEDLQNSLKVFDEFITHELFEKIKVG